MSSASQIQGHRLLQRKAQLLPWIADPLTHVIHNEHEEQHHRHASVEKHEMKGGESTTFIEAPVKIQEEIETEEASTIELFYDLFFVANLTTITSVHYMVDLESVASYILFFIILWFTWFQTSLYDIRFSVDSFYERVIKAIHFLVMIGLASVSTTWNILDSSDVLAATSKQSMSLTLMVSRFALAIQYAVTVFYARKHKKPLAPFAIHSAVMFVAGLLHLGLYLTFRNQANILKRPKLYAVWYIMVLVEVVAVVVSSSIWKVVSFKRTHLVERMGLLSLIILGEGIIVMLKAVNTVEKGSTFGQDWNASIFCVIIAAVLVIYFLYMFYFDYTPKAAHYGTVRQQVWAVLHFPFHLAIVLSVEGLRQLTTWYSFQQAVGVIDQIFLDEMKKTDPAEVFNGLRDIMYNLISYLYEEGSSKTVLKDWATVKANYATLAETPYANLTSSNQEMFQNMIDVMATGYTEFYGIKVAKKKDSSSAKNDWDDPNYSPFAPVQTLYDLVFEYFFISIGFVFIMYGVFGLFVRRGKDVWDYISVAIRFIVGITFFAIVSIRNNATAYDAYYGSSWPIPTVCLILAGALFLDKFLGVIAYRRMKASNTGGDNMGGGSMGGAEME